MTQREKENEKPDETESRPAAVDFCERRGEAVERLMESQ